MSRCLLAAVRVAVCMDGNGKQEVGFYEKLGQLYVSISDKIMHYYS